MYIYIGIGSLKCNGKRSQVCLNVTETITFSSFQVPLLRKSIESTTNSAAMINA